MTDYDKACKILIDRCKDILKQKLDSHFWQSDTGHIGVTDINCTLMWYVIFNDENNHVKTIDVLDPTIKKKSLFNREVLETIFKYARKHDIYICIGWRYKSKILNKNDTLEKLLVEYDMKYYP